MDTYETIFAAVANAKAGDTLTVGTRSFTRRPLTLRAQVALTRAFAEALNESGAATVADAFMLCFDKLIDAAAIVTQDYYATCDAEWLGAQTDVNLSDLLAIVLGQVVADKNTPILSMLAGLGKLAALSQAIAPAEGAGVAA